MDELNMPTAKVFFGRAKINQSEFNAILVEKIKQSISDILCDNIKNNTKEKIEIDFYDIYKYMEIENEYFKIKLNHIIAPYMKKITFWQRVKLFLSFKERRNYGIITYVDQKSCVNTNDIINTLKQFGYDVEITYGLYDKLIGEIIAMPKLILTENKTRGQNAYSSNT